MRQVVCDNCGLAISNDILTPPNININYNYDLVTKYNYDLCGSCTSVLLQLIKNKKLGIDDL